MRLTRTAVAIGLMAGLAVSACSREESTPPQLLNLKKSASGPDEFSILPNKPIEIPEDLAALPEPTPGASNRVDPTPLKDAVAALGGNPSRLDDNGVPASDSALIARATRFGVAEGIRTTLADEDEDFRRDNPGRFFERVFSVTTYFRAYEDLSLDQFAELERWRRLGVLTVAAPPEEAAKYKDESFFTNK